MAIGTPTAIGTNTVGAGSSGTITTSGSAPSSSLVMLFVGWGANGSARTLSSVSGGSLSWSIDHQQAYAGAIPWGYAICSAQAPSGLASSTVLTVTLSGAVFGSLLAAVYCTGLDASSPKDVSDGNGQSSGSAWDTTATSTTVANTLVIGGCLLDGNRTQTPGGSAAELADFVFATENWSLCVEYLILSATASTSLTGSWTVGSATGMTSAFVAYKMASAASEKQSFYSYRRRSARR